MSDDTKHISYKAEKFPLPHKHFLKAANLSIEEAEVSDRAKYYKIFTAVTLAAFSLEPLINVYGENLLRKWDDFDKLPVNVKLRLVCEKLDIKRPKREEPWSRVDWIIKIRNSLAHPSPEVIEELHKVDISDDVTFKKNVDSIDDPKSDLEKYITLENAKKIICIVTQIEKLLQDPAEKALPYGGFQLKHEITTVGPATGD